MKFTLFWLTGDKDIIEGSSIASAMNNAGFDASSLFALDFHAQGENNDYEFIDGRWQKKSLNQIVQDSIDLVDDV